MANKKPSPSKRLLKSEEDHLTIKAITSGTMIPISFLIVLCGALLWLSTIHANLTHASADILVIKNQIREVADIDKRLSRIEGQLDIILNKFDNPP